MTTCYGNKGKVGNKMFLRKEGLLDGKKEKKGGGTGGFILLLSACGLEKRDLELPNRKGNSMTDRGGKRRCPGNASTSRSREWEKGIWVLTDIKKGGRIGGLLPGRERSKEMGLGHKWEEW